MSDNNYTLYNNTVMDHFMNPRNMGDIKDADGIGEVGAAACGDIMKITLKIKDGRVEDARFKTFGCLTGNNRVCTPNGYKFVKDLKRGNILWTWNGTSIIKNKISNIQKKFVDIDDLRILDFGLRSKIICTKDHVWWSTDNRPLETENLNENVEVMEITERELRALNNVGKKGWLRKKNSKSITYRNSHGLMRQKELPQNQKGRKLSEETINKISESSKLHWNDPTYIKRWIRGMKSVDCWKNRPTKLEKKFIEKFQSANIDVRYVGDSKFWINTPSGNKYNPDFKVNGQRKVIEVYTKKLPHHMQNRENQGWMIDKKKEYASAGFQVAFIEINELESCIPTIQTFIHNGIALKNINPVKHKNELRGTTYKNGKCLVYDISLADGSCCYFVQRVMSHNCGSAIAASSMATELIKGKTIEELKNFTNQQIVEALGGLPPVKIHCSVLAEEALQAALEDYQRKKSLTPA